MLWRVATGRYSSENWSRLVANNLSTPIRLAATTGAIVLFVIGRTALLR